METVSSETLSISSMKILNSLDSPMKPILRFNLSEWMIRRLSLTTVSAKVLKKFSILRQNKKKHSLMKISIKGTKVC